MNTLQPKEPNWPLLAAFLATIVAIETTVIIILTIG